MDIAIKSNILYADSYVDLVAIDISDPLNVKEKSRLKKVFPEPYSYNPDTSKGVFFEYDTKEELVTEPVDCDNASPKQNLYEYSYGNVVKSAESSPGGSTQNNSGKAGSMAKFSIIGNYLYGLNNRDIWLFNLNNSSLPQLESRLTVNRTAETLFPYMNYLFIGTTSGMMVYDISSPGNPSFVSQFNHILSCDPVVVEGNLAYVTQRNGSTCRNGQNQLDIIDLSDIQNPVLKKSYTMLNPYGLGISDSLLFVCEGDYGLKVLNVKNPMSVTIMKFITDMKTYDVIPLGNNWIIIGKDGLYQYDASDPFNLKLLSKVPVSGS